MTDRLLKVLFARANHRDRVIVREDVLLQALGCESAELRQGLADLEKLHAVEILSPAPFLVLKITRSWSGRESDPAENAGKLSDSVKPGYSYSFHNKAIGKSKAIGGKDRGAGEGEEELLQAILTTLGESDPTTFRGVLAHYPETAIRSVLERIRRTPAEKVRKSKTAYFRFLLAKTAK